MTSAPSSSTSFTSSTDALWQHITRPPRASAPLFVPDLPGAAPIDKHATLVRFFAQETGAHAQRFADDAESIRKELAGLKDAVGSEHERVMRELGALVARTQEDIITATKEQTDRLHNARLDHDKLQFEHLQNRVDTLHATCQTQATALQALQEQHTDLLKRLAPVVPLLEALPTHIDKSRLELEKSQLALKTALCKDAAVARTEARQAEHDLRINFTDLSRGLRTLHRLDLRDLPPSSAPLNESSPRQIANLERRAHEIRDLERRVSKRRRIEPGASERTRSPGVPRPISSPTEDLILEFSSFPKPCSPTDNRRDHEITPSPPPRRTPSSSSFVAQRSPMLVPRPARSSSSPALPGSNLALPLSSSRLGSRIPPSTDCENEYSLPRGLPLRPLQPRPLTDIRAQTKPASPLSTRQPDTAPTPRVRPFAPSLIGNRPSPGPTRSSSTHRTQARVSVPPPAAAPASPFGLTCPPSPAQAPAAQTRSDPTPAGPSSMPPCIRASTVVPPAIEVLPRLPSSGDRQRALTLRERHARAGPRPKTTWSFGGSEDEEDELIEGGDGPSMAEQPAEGGGAEVPWFEEA